MEIKTTDIEFVDKVMENLDAATCEEAVKAREIVVCILVADHQKKHEPFEWAPKAPDYYDSVLRELDRKISNLKKQ